MPPRRRQHTSLAVAALLGSAGLLHAQDADTSARDTSAAAALVRWRVGVGAPVRVSAFGARREGQVAGADASDLLLSRAGQEWRVSVRAVDTLWGRGRATRRGGVVGAVAGGVLLGGFTLFFVNACTSGPSDDPCDPVGKRAQAVGAMGALGAVGGALTGAVVGTAFPQWRRRFP